MRKEETLLKIRESPAYRSMYRDIIRTQIQTLIDQLAYAGVESVLLTACILENDPENTTVGTDLGREFLNQDSVLCTFKEFCLKNAKDDKPDVQSTDSPQLNINLSGKRKFSEVNDSCGEESSEVRQTALYSESKRSRSLTPSLKSERKEKSTEENLNNSDVIVPKGYSKCSLCNYMSKFKANVTRHERGVHRINIEGAAMVTSYYTCGLCEYKSTYRANLMRHERSIHKITSTQGELEKRKVQFFENGDGSSYMADHDFSKYEKEAGNQTYIDGDQLFMNQSGISIGSTGNQSFNGTEKEEHSILHEPVHFDTEAGNQTVSDGNQLSLNQNSNDTGKFGNKSTPETVTDGCDDEDDGCHICNHCHQIFESLSELRSHVQNTHLSTCELICNKCEMTFDNEMNLQIHMTVHNAPKQEVCKCGKAFQYRTSLIRHERKCEFVTTSPEYSSQEQNSEKSSAETNIPGDKNVSTV